MSVLYRILSLSPYPELAARGLYYSFLQGKAAQNQEPGVKESGDNKTESAAKKIYESFLKKKTLHHNEPGVKASSDTIIKKDTEKLFRHLKEMGISEGDLLIVHSSADALKTLNCNGAEFIDLLIESVGASGTIALPAFPDESMLKTENGLKIYDPKRSVAWTGMLPNLLLRKKGAIRSLFPYNPLVAWGEKAEEMMTKNLETVYAHGKGSCWGFCAENHAKVLFLGVPTFHSNTILHVVEDYQPEFWPEDWYTEQEYLVKQSDGFIRIKTKVRDVKWSMYLSELFTERKYVKAGYIQKRDFEDISISIINDSFVMTNDIMKMWDKNRFFYLPKRILHYDKQGKGLQD